MCKSPTPTANTACLNTFQKAYRIEVKQSLHFTANTACLNTFQKAMFWITKEILFTTQKFLKFRKVL